MISSRSYRAGMTPREAIALLERDQGFDQDVVAKLASLSADSLKEAIVAGADSSSTSAFNEGKPL